MCRWEFQSELTIEALCVYHSSLRNHGLIYEAVPLPLNVFIESMANTNNAIIATLSLDPPHIHPHVSIA